jgi:thioredoxin-like negative regulator of GroEL
MILLLAPIIAVVVVIGAALILRALRALAEGLDERIEVREVDIAVEPALARQYRVMSLPTTIVLDATGQVTYINVGFAKVETLRRQLVDAGMPVAA